MIKHFDIIDLNTGKIIGVVYTNTQRARISEFSRTKCNSRFICMPVFS